MNNKKNNCFLIFLFAFGVLGNLSAQEYAKAFLSKLKTNKYQNWEEKQKDIVKIFQEKTKLTKDSKKELINIFKNEYNKQQKHMNILKKQGLSEAKEINKFRNKFKRDYFRYYALLGSLVSSFRDINTIPALLNAMHYYGPVVNPGSIAQMGDSAVEVLLDVAKSKDKELRSTAFFVLSVWVNAPVFAEDYSIPEDFIIKDKLLLKRIKTLFMNGLEETSGSERWRAVYGLKAFPEEEVVKKLKYFIKKNDPEYKKGYFISNAEKTLNEIEKCLAEQEQQKKEKSLKKSTTEQIKK